MGRDERRFAGTGGRTFASDLVLPGPKVLDSLTRQDPLHKPVRYWVALVALSKWTGSRHQLISFAHTVANALERLKCFFQILLGMSCRRHRSDPGFTTSNRWEDD